jgi:hypothetical protein
MVKQQVTVQQQKSRMASNEPTMISTKWMISEIGLGFKSIRIRIKGMS